MALRQITGWLLLILGILIILWVLYSSYNIFTAKTEVPEIFSAKGGSVIDEKMAEEKETQDLQSQMEGMMGQMIGEQLKGLLPADVLPKLFNLIAWSIFAGISIFAGAQISGLGIKLIKD